MRLVAVAAALLALTACSAAATSSPAVLPDDTPDGPVITFPTDTTYAIPEGVVVTLRPGDAAAWQQGWDVDVMPVEAAVISTHTVRPSDTVTDGSIGSVTVTATGKYPTFTVTVTNVTSDEQFDIRMRVGAHA